MPGDGAAGEARGSKTVNVGMQSFCRLDAFGWAKGCETTEVIAVGFDALRSEALLHAAPREKSVCPGGNWTSGMWEELARTHRSHRANDTITCLETASLASSTTKKVQVWRFDREPLSGFVNQNTYLSDSGIELLTNGGSIQVLVPEEVRCIYFVRDFHSVPPKKTFLTRPKLDGLWVRLTYRDGDELEGVVPNSLLGIERAGFTLTPPDFTGNNQKAFVPRAAIREVQVLGVVGSPLKRGTKKAAARGQFDLFEQEAAR